MKIIEPSAELLTPFDGTEVLKFIEKCGRVCYRSEKNITPDSAEKFVRILIKRGHESVLEHFSCTFKIVCDRGVMAELTRHRLCSFSIESTRYVDYSGEDLKFILPKISLDNFEFAAADAESYYKELRKAGATPEYARAVLPNALATTIIMTANLREWRHILKLRTSQKAQPQMRQIMTLIFDTLKDKLPSVFEDCNNG